ncbi:hypothetical protein COBT_001098 [Conglomerata obtusa]
MNQQTQQERERMRPHQDNNEFLDIIKGRFTSRRAPAVFNQLRRNYERESEESNEAIVVSNEVIQNVNGDVRRQGVVEQDGRLPITPENREQNGISRNESLGSRSGSRIRNNVGLGDNSPGNVVSNNARSNIIGQSQNSSPTHNSNWPYQNVNNNVNNARNNATNGSTDRLNSNTTSTSPRANTRLTHSMSSIYQELSSVNYILNNLRPITISNNNHNMENHQSLNTERLRNTRSENSFTNQTTQTENKNTNRNPQAEDDVRIQNNTGYITQTEDHSISHNTQDKSNNPNQNIQILSNNEDTTEISEMKTTKILNAPYKNINNNPDHNLKSPKITKKAEKDKNSSLSIYASNVSVDHDKNIIKSDFEDKHSNVRNEGCLKADLNKNSLINNINNNKNTTFHNERENIKKISTTINNLENKINCSTLNDITENKKDLSVYKIINVDSTTKILDIGKQENNSNTNKNIEIKKENITNEQKIIDKEIINKEIIDKVQKCKFDGFKNTKGELYDQNNSIVDKNNKEINKLNLNLHKNEIKDENFCLESDKKNPVFLNINIDNPYTKMKDKKFEKQTISQVSDAYSMSKRENKLEYNIEQNNSNIDIVLNSDITYTFANDISINDEMKAKALARRNRNRTVAFVLNQNFEEVQIKDNIVNKDNIYENKNESELYKEKEVLSALGFINTKETNLYSMQLQEDKINNRRNVHYISREDVNNNCAEDTRYKNEVKNCLDNESQTTDTTYINDEIRRNKALEKRLRNRTVSFQTLNSMKEDIINVQEKITNFNTNDKFKIDVVESVETKVRTLDNTNNINTLDVIIDADKLNSFIKDVNVLPSKNKEIFTENLCNNNSDNLINENNIKEVNVKNQSIYDIKKITEKLEEKANPTNVIINRFKCIIEDPIQKHAELEICNDQSKAISMTNEMIDKIIKETFTENQNHTNSIITENIKSFTKSDNIKDYVCSEESNNSTFKMNIDENDEFKSIKNEIKTNGVKEICTFNGNKSFEINEIKNNSINENLKKNKKFEINENNEVDIRNNSIIKEGENVDGNSLVKDDKIKEINKNVEKVADAIKYINDEENKSSDDKTNVIFNNKNIDKVEKEVKVNDKENKGFGNIFGIEERIIKKDVNKHLKLPKELLCNGVEEETVSKNKYTIQQEESILLDTKLIELNSHRLRPEESVPFNNLSEEDKKLFTIYCCKRIRALDSKSIFAKIVGYFKRKLYPRPNEFYYNEKQCHEFFYELLEHLKKKAPNTHGIFRLSTAKQCFKEIPLELKKGYIYDYQDVNTINNGGIFKGYIREHLDGLYPPCLNSALFSIYSRSDVLVDTLTEDLDVFKMCFPFTNTPLEREIVKKIFELFNEIFSKVKINQMTIENLTICLGPNFFPGDFVKELSAAKAPAKLVYILYHLDHDNIDKRIYKQFLKYKKENKL